MSQERPVKKFVGNEMLFTFGSISLDSPNGESSLSLYYDLEKGSPLEEITFDNKAQTYISDRWTILQKNPVNFGPSRLERVTLPGASIVGEKLTNSAEDGESQIAYITPGLSKTHIDFINSLNEIRRSEVVNDLQRYYPRFIVTQGNMFEAYLGETFTLWDYPGFQSSSSVEGFVTPFIEKTNGRTTWKIAKEYPEEKDYEKLVLSFGLDYTSTSMDEEIMKQRSDEFIKAMELKGKDALDILDQIARPSIEIRRQSLYDTDTSTDR